MSGTLQAPASVPRPGARTLEMALAGTDTSPLFSIHDVMPETMEPVTQIVQRLKAHGILQPILLVVPGRNWQTAGLAQLRAWADSGIQLAGHGWNHASPPPDTLYHRVHSALISRNVAEHLALGSGGIQELLQRNHAWFAEQYLPSPEFYVPPAWAMGAIARSSLATMPFRYYETLTGIFDAVSGHFQTLPLVGFEADTPLRATVLRASNAANRALANRWKRPLRIAIHPHDFALRLRRDLEETLENHVQTR